MGVEAVNEDQKAVIEYVKDHIVGWLEGKNIIPFPQTPRPVDTQLIERMVRVEEALNRQNDKFDAQNEKFDLQTEKFNILIDNMGKRFTSLETRLDQRFEEVNRRISHQGLYHLATFTAVIGAAVAINMRA